MIISSLHVPVDEDHKSLLSSIWKTAYYVPMCRCDLSYPSSVSTKNHRFAFVQTILSTRSAIVG